MENYLLTGLGISVSILLFIIGYRQTIGAKKERIISSNSEIEKILIRRIVIENYNPNIIDISRLIEGKARDYKVKIGDLLSENQMLNCIYTHIMETDFITQEQRSGILKRILPIIIESENSSINEEKDIIIDQSERKKRIANQLFVTIIMAITASTAGGLLTTILKPNILTTDINNILTALITSISISLAVILLISIFKSFKDSQQEVSITSRSQGLEDAITFEKEVAKFISKKIKNIYAAGPTDRGYDFIIESNSNKYLIEVKSWSKPIPHELISRFLKILNESVEKEKAKEGIIITRKQTQYKNINFNNEKVKIMSFDEFKKYISRI